MREVHEMREMREMREMWVGMGHDMSGLEQHVQPNAVTPPPSWK